MKKSSGPQPDQVFLNLPFDKNFEPVFVGYVVGLVTLGMAPRSVLDLEEDGDGRMARLFRLLSQCRSSVHDLSYLGKERRYNMPFELGVAYALTRDGTGRRIYVFEAARHDLLKTLTDLRHFDPRRHGMSGKKALEAIYECFYSPKRPHPEAIGHRIYSSLIKKLPEFRQGKPTLFNRKSFLLLVHATLIGTQKLESS